MEAHHAQLIGLDEAVARLHAAGLTDLSRKWLSDAIDRGKIPATVVARKRRVRSDVLDRMVKDWLAEADFSRPSGHPSPSR